MLHGSHHSDIYATVTTLPHLSHNVLVVATVLRTTADVRDRVTHNALFFGGDRLSR